MHITKVKLLKFKRYKDETIELKDGLSLVVGGNNSGKSTILQALAAWQFCKTLIEVEKGREGWIQVSKKSGVGMGIVDFTPLQVPSLSHLWTNLKTSKEHEPDGYTLKINVFWNNKDGKERYLEMGMSLVNDRLFVKSMSTNLVKSEILDSEGKPINESVPSVAYLPPFAGITDREGKLTPALRERLIGQGLSGGVIRNMLYELHENNKNIRQSLKDKKTKISQSDLDKLRKTDSWEILTHAAKVTFGAELTVRPFNERYHSYLKVEVIKGTLQKNGILKRHTGYNSRDLMVEGQGFLQWLSVYALMLSPGVDVILLDEPDAHLNAGLQKDLLQSLDSLSKSQSKQVLMATHSPELIRLQDHEKILSVAKDKTKYLADSDLKIGILAGIGTHHSPTIHALLEHKKILILEGVSDYRFLKKIAEKAKFKWPTNLVPWYWTGSASERAQLFRQLKNEIPGLEGISIRDRDNEEDSSVSKDLIDKGYIKKDGSNGFKSIVDGLTILKWRRRHIENYLISSSAISRAAGVPKEVIGSFFAGHALAIPEDTTPSDIAFAIRDAHGKELMIKGNSIKSIFGINRDQIADVLLETEVAEDFKTFFKEISKLCSPPQPQSK